MQIQLVPDSENMRYDMLIEAREKIGDDADKFVEAFDRYLGELNVEYRTKRDSNRLSIPQLSSMRPGWAIRSRRHDVEQLGKRDAQYKWQMLKSRWDTMMHREVDDD